MKVNKMKFAFWVCIAITLACLFWVFISDTRSDETQELVEDLRWKHYPFSCYVEQPDIEWWAQRYPYIWFEDGTFYVTTEDVTWFIEMQRKEE